MTEEGGSKRDRLIDHTDDQDDDDLGNMAWVVMKQQGLSLVTHQRLLRTRP